MAPPMASPRRIFALLACAGLAGEPLVAQDVPQGLRCPAPSSIRAAPSRDGVLPEAGKPPPAAPASPLAGSDAPIEVSSDAADLGIDGDAELRGAVTLRQGERSLSADQVEYDAQTGRFRVRGLVRYADPALRAEGQSGSWDPQGGAAFEDTAFEMPDRPARGAAQSMELAIDGKVTLSQVWFSTCPAETPDWRIRASRIELDTRTRNGTGRDAAIEFKGVPILYLPYLSFPLGDQRKSGFLFPNVGYSTRGGIEATLPYYFNLAPNYDLLLEPTVYGRRGVDLGGQFRYLTRQHRGELRANLLPSDSIRNIDRNWLRLRHRSDLPAGWRFDIDAQSVSDAEYFEDFAAGAEGTSTAFLRRMARLSYRDDRWQLRAEAEQFQTIDRALTLLDRPAARLPRVLASGSGTREGTLPIDWSVEAEVVNFDRDAGVEGWRTDLAPQLGLRFGDGRYFLRPAVGWRHTRYDLEGVAQGGEERLSRSLPFASLDAGLRLEREGSENERLRATLEPRMLYLWTPWRAQDHLPIFDTALPDLDFVQLFRNTRYVGVDRIADANHLSTGFTSRIFDRRSGRQLLTATLGQTYRFTPSRVRLPGEATSAENRSDLLAQLGITAWRDWNVSLGLQWDPAARRQQRSHARVQYRPDAERALNLAYRFQRDRLEQGELSGAWPLAQRWNAFGRVVYDLQDRSSLERFAGLEFKACCWRLRLVGRRFVSSRTGERDTGVYLQLELNGLASVGSSADAFLDEAIRGYSSVGLSR